MANTQANDVLNQLVTNTQRAAEAKSKSQDIYSAIADVGNELVDFLSGGFIPGTQDTPLSLKTKKLSELEVQTRKQEMLTAAQMSGEGAARVTNILAESLTNQAKERERLNAEYMAKQSVSFLDSPLDWLMNQVTAPFEEEKLAATDARMARTADSIKKINDGLQQTAVTENEYAKKFTAASVESVATAAQNELNATVANARLQSLRLSAQGVKELFSFDSVGVDNAFKANQVKNSEEQLRLSRESHALARQRAELEFKQIKEKEEFKDYVAAAMNKAIVDSGGNAVSPSQAFMLINSPGAVGKQAQLMFEVGSAAIMNKGVLRLGDNPVEVLTTMQKLNIPEPKDSQQRLVLDLVGKSYEAAKLQPGVKEGKMSEQVAANEALKSKVRDYNTNIDSRDKTNPYIAPPLTVLSQSRAVANTALYSKVLAPLVTAGGLKESEPKEIAKLALDGVKAGKLTAAEFVQGMTTLYKVAAEANNQKAQFEKFGVPAQTSYRAATGFGSYSFSSSQYGASGGSMPVPQIRSTASLKVIDWTDPVDVNKFLVTSQNLNNIVTSQDPALPK
jgi:hypothetical protein